MSESNYSLRILKAINEEANPDLEKLIQESKELQLIWVAIVQKARNNNLEKRQK